MLRIYPSPIYHFPEAVGFGDRWKIVSFLIETSDRTKKVQLVNKKNWHRDIVEIKSQLNSNGDFKWTTEAGNRYLDHTELYMAPYCRTHTAWIPNNSKTVCYQLDGRYRQKEKNLTKNETNRLFDCLHTLGYKIIDLGNMRPLDEIIQIMSEAFAFIGVPSGISHVGVSVGIPEYIICKHWITPSGSHSLEFHKKVIYNNKNVNLFSSVDDFLLSFQPGVAA